MQRSMCDLCSVLRCIEARMRQTGSGTKSPIQCDTFWGVRVCGLGSEPCKLSHILIFSRNFYLSELKKTSANRSIPTC